MRGDAAAVVGSFEPTLPHDVRSAARSISRAPSTARSPCGTDRYLRRVGHEAEERITIILGARFVLAEALPATSSHSMRRPWSVRVSPRPRTAPTNSSRGASGNRGAPTV